MRVEVPLVTLDVSVLNQEGFFVNELTKESFRVFEDGVPQTISGFSRLQSPVTSVLLVEYSVESYRIELNALRSCLYFMQELQPEDWTALVLFDKEPHLIQDFTRDRSALQASANQAGIPLLREINLFDALYDTLDRLQGLDGRKYVILLASGEDTFSHKTLDDLYAKIESAKGTVIYSIETDRDSEHRQETNQMRSFARMSGGQFFFASSPVEFQDVFHTIGQSIRQRYILRYHPSHKALDGAWHKIKIEVVTNTGHKEPYQILARDGYRAKRAGP